jgi:hypothetical protein
MKELEGESGVKDLIDGAMDLAPVIKKLYSLSDSKEKMARFEQLLMTMIRDTGLGNIIGRIAKVKGHYASKQARRQRLAAMVLMLNS